MKIRFLDLHQQYLSIKTEIDNSISNVISDSAYIKGKYVSFFESKFSKLNNCNHCISVGNGTDALYISLKVLGIKSGDEVIVPSQSWVSTVECVLQLDAKPVFVDVDEYYSIDYSKIERKISSKTKAVIAVHLFGQMCEMESIKNICNDHNLFLIEDCAQSHFSKFKGKYAGIIGDIGTFSFYPGKNLGAYGDAGAITTNDDELAKRSRMFANHGGLKKHSHEIQGINSRMDGLQASILTVKMDKIFEWTESRIKISRKYTKEFSKTPQIKTPLIRRNTKHSFHQYVIKTKERDLLKDYLLSNGIETLIHYPVSLPYIPLYNKYIEENEQFPVAKMNQEECLSLPIYPELSEKEIDYIINTIKNFFEMNKKVLFHYNVPFDIHQKAYGTNSYNQNILKYSTFASGIKKGFEENGFSFEIETVNSFFFDKRKVKKKFIYKYFFSIYNFFFGFIDNFFLLKKLSNKLINEKFTIYFTELNPIATRGFLQKLKFNSIKTIQWFGVFPNNIGFNKRPLKNLPFYNLTVSSANLLPFFKIQPHAFKEVLPVYNPDFINFFEKNNKKPLSYDILFIGSFSRIHSNRWDIIEFINSNFESFGIYGYKIEDVPDHYEFKKNFKGSVWGKEYYDLIKNSKININLFLDDFDKLESGLNLRIIEIIASKSFVLTQNKKTLFKYFKINHEIVVFDDLEELYFKIEFYLENIKKRKQIIDNGYKIVKDFTYKNQIFDILN